MPTVKIAISFFACTLFVILNKNFIGSNNVEFGDIWHKWYFTINALAYSIPALVINNYLKGWKQWAFSIVPAFYLDWAYASYFNAGNVYDIDYLQIIAGALIIGAITNHKPIKKWIVEKL